MVDFHITLSIPDVGYRRLFSKYLAAGKRGPKRPLHVSSATQSEHDECTSKLHGGAAHALFGIVSRSPVRYVLE